MTAASELRAEPEQYLYLVHVIPETSTNVAIVGEIEHILQSAGHSRVLERHDSGIVNLMRRVNERVKLGDSIQRTLLIDAFFAEMFSRKVDRSYEHKVSAAFASQMYRRGFGVSYPSVEVRGGLNIALSPAMFCDNWSVVALMVAKVAAFHGYAVYDLEPIKVAKAFDEDGTITSWLQVADDLNAVPRVKWKASLAGDEAYWRSRLADDI